MKRIARAVARLMADECGTAELIKPEICDQMETTAAGECGTYLATRAIADSGRSRRIDDWRIPANSCWPPPVQRSLRSTTSGSPLLLNPAHADIYCTEQNTTPSPLQPSATIWL